MDRVNEYYDVEELEQYGQRILQLVVRLYKQQEQYEVQPQISPGEVRSKLQQQAPEEGEQYEQILEDTEQIIFRNMTQWQHPKMFGYFPAASSHVSIIAEIFKSGFQSPNFTWYSSPSATELENHVLDWAADFLSLPQYFKFSGRGGGQISSSTCDALMYSIHASKILKMRQLSITNTDPRITKFVAYISTMSYHFEKPIRMKDIPYIRKIPYIYNVEQNEFILDPDDYRRQIEEDISGGLIPFWVGLNLDAAYLGSAQICEEYKYLSEMLNGVDYYVVNFGKWMLTGINSSLFWVKYRHEYISTFHRDWQTNLSHKFSAFRVWFVIRKFGLKRLRDNIKKHVQIAKYFESLVLSNKEFQVLSTVKSGLVCFRYYNQYIANTNSELLNTINKMLFEKIKENTTHGHIVSSHNCGIYFLRFVVNNHNTNTHDADLFWQHCQTSLQYVLKSYSELIPSDIQKKI